MAGTRQALRRFWNALPIDGAGFVPPADPDARWLIRHATRTRLRGVPRPLLPLVVLAGRLLLCVKAIRWARRSDDPLRVYADACLYGLLPRDSRMWRGPVGAPPRPMSPGALALAMSSMGNAEQRRLLTDKSATAALIARHGVAVPKLVTVIPRGTADPVLPEGEALFVKPQSGSRGQDAFRVDRVDPSVAARLKRAAAGDALLVQHCLAPAPELADLATGGIPPVLRLIMAREPRGAPFLHSALFSVRVPGETHPLRGLLRAPVSVADGRLLAGFWLGEPEARYDRSPWHDAPLAGRVLPDFDAAVRAALTATAPFDGLPSIGWDVVLSDAGPVILEGNAHTDWLYILRVAEGAPDAPPLLPLLRRWAEA